MNFRAAHAALRPDDFYTGAQLRWFRPDGGPADANYFDNPDNHAIARMLDGAAFQDAAKAIYIAYNAFSADVTFQLPAAPGGTGWFLVMDTSPFLEATANIAAAGSEKPLKSLSYSLGARAVLLAIAR